ncbi:hypothetical protein [Tomitella cavernea]|uniref:Uncharacterized protein n=1 Tax=Tomitella cavernea TaxID=1387982 RepID=A0ABP9C3Q8_9ACTN|nr:hypothetical protein [Tomitella cavernea]
MQQPARGRLIGSLVAAGFGLIYVLVNSWPLPSAAAWAVRIAAIALATATTASVAVGTVRASDGPGDARTAPPGLARGYWMIVAAEVVALFGGLAVINGLLDAPRAGVAWVSVVVGLHFFPMARLFRLAFFRLIGGAVGACGVAGLVFAGLDSSGEVTAIVAGVLPGLILLCFAAWGSTRWWITPRAAEPYP